MYPDFTLPQLIALLDVSSSAAYEAVYDSLRNTTNEPLSWDAPGDEAEYITQLRIGEMGSPHAVHITFSKHGNLCFLDLPSDPLVESSLLEDILRRCGWTLVSPQAAKLVLYATTHETVHDRFFNYV